MAVKKIGNRFHPIGKKGPWKSSFPTKAKAEAALRNINKLSKGKKKTTRKAKTSTRKSKPKKLKAKKNKTKKRGNKMAKKKNSKKQGLSITGLFRGAMYGGTLAAPGIKFYQARIDAGASIPTAVGDTLASYGGRNFNTGKFDLAVLTNRLGPVAVWSVIDLVASKLGVWKRMGRLLPKL